MPNTTVLKKATPEIIKKGVEQAQAASEINKTSESKVVPQDLKDPNVIYNILKKFGGGGEASRQLPDLEGQMRESADVQAKGKRPEEEFRGGQTHGNLAAGLSSAILDIQNKLKEHPELNTVAALKNAKNYLLKDPKTRALIEHPEFQKMFPDFWDRINQNVMGNRN